MKRRTICIVVFLLLGTGALAAQQDSQQAAEPAAQPASDFDADLKYAQVRQVNLRENSDGSWRIAVTLRHADTGWDHYADLWQVLDAESGEVIAERPLAHPHTNEQPFTRSLSRVEIPEGVETIRIRAKCTRHGYQGRQMLISLDSARAGQ